MRESGGPGHVVCVGSRAGLDKRGRMLLFCGWPWAVVGAKVSATRMPLAKLRVRSSWVKGVAMEEREASLMWRQSSRKSSQIEAIRLLFFEGHIWICLSVSLYVIALYINISVYFTLSYVYTITVIYYTSIIKCQVLTIFDLNKYHQWFHMVQPNIFLLLFLLLVIHSKKTFCSPFKWKPSITYYK